MCALYRNNFRLEVYSRAPEGGYMTVRHNIEEGGPPLGLRA